MSRPTTKTDLIAAAKEQFGKLCKLIDSMTEKNKPGDEENQNVDYCVYCYNEIKC